MKLGDVLEKERSRRGLTAAQVAARMGVSAEEYGRIAAGDTPAESWGPLLAQLAIELETPTSRLLSESGRAADAQPGAVGEHIRRWRERRGRAPEELATALGVPLDDYHRIEAGESQLETYGPLLLAFSEAVDQPVFNLFYPCGLPFQSLDDYP